MKVISQLFRADRAPAWFTSAGAWGDMLASVGNIQAICKRLGIEATNIIHVGYDPPGVKRFLEDQPLFSQVVARMDNRHPNYLEIFRRGTFKREDPMEWLPLLVEGTDIDPAEVYASHITYDFHSGAASIPELPTLTLPESKFWAARALYGRGGLTREKVVLLHPYSGNSTREDEHWRDWGRAIDGLCRTYPEVTFLLTGLGSAPYLPYPNLLDLRGQTTSMMGVYALADLADGVISTSNSLPQWCAVSGRKCLLMAGAQFGPGTYFRRWNERANTLVLDYSTSLQTFEQISALWLKDL